MRTHINEHPCLDIMNYSEQQETKIDSMKTEMNSFRVSLLFEMFHHNGTLNAFGSD